MDESGTSEVVESAQVQISLGYYKIERLQSKTIQVLDLKTKNYIQPVKPILRAIIDELNLDIGGLLLSTGAKKNTRTLGRQVIKALNQSEENPHELQ